MGVLYLIGYIVNGKFGEYLLLGLHPFVWSVAVSTLAIVLANKISKPTDSALVEKFFGKNA